MNDYALNILISKLKNYRGSTNNMDMGYTSLKNLSLVQKTNAFSCVNSSRWIIIYSTYNSDLDILYMRCLKISVWHINYKINCSL